MESIIKGALLGVISTVILYLFPLIGFAAPLIGGGIGGYITGKGIDGGLKVGIWMTILMIIPGILFSTILASALTNSPLAGILVASGGILLTLIIIAHTAILGIIGAVIGGMYEANKL